MIRYTLVQVSEELRNHLISSVLKTSFLLHNLEKDEWTKLH